MLGSPLSFFALIEKGEDNKGRESVSDVAY